MSKDEADEDQGIISSCFQTPPCIVHIAAFVCVDTHSACPYSYQASVDSETCTQSVTKEESMTLTFVFHLCTRIVSVLGSVSGKLHVHGIRRTRMSLLFFSKNDHHI